MFTGIIEEIGTVERIQRNGIKSDMVIRGQKVLEGTKCGDSIAVNGICLTVTKLDKQTFTADVMNETLSRSSLSGIRVGSKVNLERAMINNGRFGGHIVSGHVDGTGIIQEIKQDGIAVWYKIQTKPEIRHYIVEKGSIAIDGISLTVAKVGACDFSVSVIPHTAKETILSDKKVGDVVNLENDIVGKYVERFVTGMSAERAGEMNKNIKEEAETARRRENERWKNLCLTQ